MLERLFRNIYSTDAPRHIRDDLFREMPAQKVLASGTCWRGELRPIVDTLVQALAPLRNGAAGILVAEPAPRFDPGRLWVGGLVDTLAQRIRAGARDAVSEPLDQLVDLTELASVVGDLRAERIGDLSTSVRLTDRAEALLQARDRIEDISSRSTAASGAARVNDSGTLAGLLNSARAINEAANLKNRELEKGGFWDGGGAAPSRAIGDSNPSTRVRDLIAQANRLPPSRERNELLAEVGRAHWAGV